MFPASDLTQVFPEVDMAGEDDVACRRDLKVNGQEEDTDEVSDIVQDKRSNGLSRNVRNMGNDG